MRARSRIFVVLLALAGAARAEDAREIGRKYQAWFLAGDAALWPHFSTGMQKLNGGSVEAFATARESDRKKSGRRLRVVEEMEQYLPGVLIYRQKAVFEHDYAAFTWWIDAASGRVEGLKIGSLPPDELGRAEAPTKFLEYQTKSKLRLPFDGAWRVFWGGRTLDVNQHASEPPQRFAYDLDRDDCLGQPILAPAAATVVVTVDGLADGARDVKNPAGNYVHLDLGNGEYALLAHLQKGSIAVKKGARVKAGQLVGKCGDSGNSSQPHLHFHLESSPRPLEGEGLPAQFVDYFADGKRVARGEPARGQVISMDAPPPTR